MLRNIWFSNEISKKTKLRIFSTNIISVVLYGSETWALTKKQATQIQTFVNKCLRRIMNIYWPNQISNKELWQITKQEPIETSIKRKKWKWIGHTLRKPPTDITRQALDYTIRGKRKQGRPTLTWRRNVNTEIRRQNKTWGQVKELANNKERWKQFVESICNQEEE